MRKMIKQICLENLQTILSRRKKELQEKMNPDQIERFFNKIAEEKFHPAIHAQGSKIKHMICNYPHLLPGIRNKLEKAILEKINGNKIGKAKAAPPKKKTAKKATKAAVTDQEKKQAKAPKRAAPKTKARQKTTGPEKKTAAKKGTRTTQKTAKSKAPAKPKGKAAKKSAPVQNDADQVVKIVRRFTKGIDIPTLSDRTGLDKNQLTGILQSALKKGLIKRVSRGVYAKGS
jgi:hypothetical protein